MNGKGFWVSQFSGGVVDRISRAGTIHETTRTDTKRTRSKIIDALTWLSRDQSPQVRFENYDEGLHAVKNQMNHKAGK